MAERYDCRKIDHPVCGTVEVPGSKSVTNRALFLAAMADGTSTLQGVLFSDDTRHFLDALVRLGYVVRIDEAAHTVTIKGCKGEIPNKKASIYVGCAGTAARFLTAMLGVSEGEYEILCDEQMKKRPMKPLFDALISLGAVIEYVEEPGALPVRIKNKKRVTGTTLCLDISKSTQFLSACLMIAPLLQGALTINVTSEKKCGSYVLVTMKMMEEYGVRVDFDGASYQIEDNQFYKNGERVIEPDMSAACYFYAIAAVTGGDVLVKNIHSDISQGDIAFLRVLEAMGCTKEETADGIRIIGAKNGLSGVSVDMNDFSDQCMTLAAIACFASGPVTISNIAHVRGQESDRLSAIANALGAMGIACDERPDGITIYPGTPKPAVIDTANDHRMAMSFAITGLMADGIVIDNPMCCRKTFEHYFDVLDTLLSEK